MRKVLIGLFILMVGFNAYSNQVIERDLTDNEKKEIEKTVKEKLKDPYTADFKHNKLIYEGKSGVYCGMVNSKNSYGAYAGFTPFNVFIVDTVNDKGERVFVVAPITVSDATDNLSVESVNKFCRQKGYKH
ncbi:hypothetical protein KDV38_00210 [Providencia rettgeri]